MNFTRLHLHGFKSFVEPADLHIGPGMTGIVGPNGCGKSNLVEALRWVMGENSAKSLRGGEMDDVIFAGTAMRPSRNVAEVMLELDNSNRSATAEFNNDETLQVMRQIERGEGSDYRINGKPVRRRDVQLLFADQATGSHSTNLVGQGQIDALIRAKPQDRRQILEEAAGTSGLQARRHEAELKLKAAEQNLTRVDDVLQNFDQQLRSLKTQMRQASRYRNLADHIRRVEAGLLYLRWMESEQNAQAATHSLAEAEARATELLSIVTQGNTARATFAADLPPLRQAEATAAAIVQKLALARDQLETEARRIAQETQEQAQRLDQTKGDLAREAARRKDGEEAVVALAEEAARLATAQAAIAEDLPRVEETLAALTKEVEALDDLLARSMQEAATAEAQKESLHKETTLLLDRRATLTKNRAEADAKRAVLAAEAAQRPELALARAMVDATESEFAKRQAQAQEAEHFYRETEALHAEARELAQKMEGEATKLRAERDALAALLQTHDESHEKVIDLITVTPGLESALAVAVGEALTAALDTKAAKHWRALEPLTDAPALPAGSVPLTTFVKAPPALARCLSQIGLMENAQAGEAAASDLRAGQILVSRDGWAWRWDGFTLTPEAKTSTALRLQQRNRVSALYELIATAEAEFEIAQEALEQAALFLSQRQEEDRRSRDALNAAFAALNDARSAHAEQEKEATALTSKLAAVEASMEQIDGDLDRLRTRALEIEDKLKALPDPAAARAALEKNRFHLADLRGRRAVNQSECDRLTQTRDMNAARAATIASEKGAWQTRLSAAGHQIDSLSARLAETEARLEEIRQKPAEIEAARVRLLTELSDAESRRKSAADVLIENEQKLAALEAQLKRDEHALAEARETRVRAESAVEASAEHFKTLRERMEEKLTCAPEELPKLAAFDENASLPSAFDLEQTLARYTRERENIGPVNLRADVESEAIQTQVDSIQKEKDDLIAAIAKLRQGITHLNREAKDRLNDAFTAVNDRFQSLYKGLFDGGRAYLELIDSEDPMNAGLEIFASPPGKKMQALSLLSGGERSLTALALLFAVFQTNPSPICVLDEAEAALDESNVGRFCSLIDRISKETGTRFLIITHQRMTMARMDRLYGVTMAEKGVSQLVSVDLEAALSIREGGGRAEEALLEVQAA